MNSPFKLPDEYVQGFFKAGQSLLQTLTPAPGRGDRRFNAAEWRDNPVYSLLKQSCLLNSRLLTDIVEAAELDDATKHKLRFYTRQFVDAMSLAKRKPAFLQR